MLHDALETMINDRRPAEDATTPLPPAPRMHAAQDAPKTWWARALDRFNDVSERMAWPSISCVS